MKRSPATALTSRGKHGAKAKQREFRVCVAGTTGRAHFAYLRRRLSAAEKLVGGIPRDLSVALVGDKQMSQLHQQYLNIPGPTDVLTFEISHDSHGRVTFGELIVCVPEAQRQARKNASTVRKELLLYALHGMLHLSGFDDKTARGYRAMHRKEDQILTRLGVGPVFCGGARRRGTKPKDR